jgi:hypothetical protein
MNVWMSHRLSSSDRILKCSHKTQSVRVQDTENRTCTCLIEKTKNYFVEIHFLERFPLSELESHHFCSSYLEFPNSFFLRVWVSVDTIIWSKSRKWCLIEKTKNYFVEIHFLERFPLSELESHHFCPSYLEFPNSFFLRVWVSVDTI